MEELSLYPPITVKNEDGKIVFSNMYKSFEISLYKKDLFLNDCTLYGLFILRGFEGEDPFILDDPQDNIYNCCNLLLTDQFITRYVVYHEGFEKWYCSDDDLDIDDLNDSWTSDPFDDYICLHRTDENELDDLLVYHTRYFI